MNLLLQNTNVIGDSKQNTICLLGRYNKIGVFSCIETKNESCMCVVLTDLPKIYYLSSYLQNPTIVGFLFLTQRKLCQRSPLAKFLVLFLLSRRAGVDGQFNFGRERKTVAPSLLWFSMGYSQI